MPPRNIVIGHKVSPELAQRARELRSNQTPAEQLLWEKLRGNRLNGWYFRRQQIIGGCIIHASRREYDANRDRTLAEYGVRVLRFQMKRWKRIYPPCWHRFKPHVQKKTEQYRNPPSAFDVILSPNALPRRTPDHETHCRRQFQLLPRLFDR